MDNLIAQIKTFLKQRKCKHSGVLGIWERSHIIYRCDKCDKISIIYGKVRSVENVDN